MELGQLPEILQEARNVRIIFQISRDARHPDVLYYTGDLQ